MIAPAEDGKRFFLMSDSLGSMDVGAPVFYKQLQVGEVIDYELLDNQDRVQLELFIRAPYFQYVHDNTRFWNASGVELNMNSTWAEFRMESLISVIIGGIAFETPAGVAGGKSANRAILLYCTAIMRIHRKSNTRPGCIT